MFSAHNFDIMSVEDARGFDSAHLKNDPTTTNEDDYGLTSMRRKKASRRNKFSMTLEHANDTKNAAITQSF